MATNHVEDVKNQGNNIVSEYETDMNSIIDANNAAKDKALGEIGEMGADGKWTEGSAIGALIDSQNEQTDFSIQQIEQQKAQAGKDYVKEQSGAYADWQKQSNPYGANAEAMASNGMQNSGYSETSQVSMYNQYQARVTAAREAYQKIILDYDNQMTAARMQNNATIAQIAYEGLQKRLEVMMQFTMQGTELLTTLASQKAAIKQQNLQNYMSVYNQLQESGKEYGVREDETEVTTDDINVDNSAELGVDALSVAKLGINGLTPALLNRLIEVGYVEEYEKDGSLQYIWTPEGQKKKHLYTGENGPFTLPQKTYT